jgi:hypothetical protein
MSPKKTTDLSTGYTQQYDRELKNILKRHGADDLLNEIELLRYLNLLVLKRMKAEGKKLTYRDHLETLRAFTNSAGRIAQLVEVQYRVFDPLAQREAAHKAGMDAVYQRILEIANLILGEEKMGDVEFKTMMKMLSEYEGGRR